jgi:uridine phosphorylase
MADKQPPSELIQHPDGRIYHLNLHPFEIAPTILLVGDPKRVYQVSQFFDKVKIQQENREFLTHTGTYKGFPLSVISTGIGPDNIDIVVNELDALVNAMPNKEEGPAQPLNLIRLGTCGALQPSKPPGSMLLSRYAIGLDNIKTFYELPETPDETDLKEALDTHWKKAGIRLPFNVTGASPKLFDYLSSFSSSGLTLTCPGFYGPQGRAIRLSTAHNFIPSLTTFHWQDLKVQNLEMESSALFALAKGLGHDAITVCLALANRSTTTHLQDHKKVMDQMIELALNDLSRQSY